MTDHARQLVAKVEARLAGALAVKALTQREAARLRVASHASRSVPKGMMRGLEIDVTVDCFAPERLMATDLAKAARAAISPMKYRLAGANVAIVVLRWRSEFRAKEPDEDGIWHHSQTFVAAGIAG